VAEAKGTVEASYLITFEGEIELPDLGATNLEATFANTGFSSAEFDEAQP
jgi:hypothetical protein